MIKSCVYDNCSTIISLIIIAQFTFSWSYTTESNAVITRSTIVRYYIDNYRNWARISTRCWSTRDHLCPALTVELWDVFCEYLWENWPCYNSTAVYLPLNDPTKNAFRHQWKTILNNRAHFTDHKHHANIIDLIHFTFTKYYLTPSVSGMQRLATKAPHAISGPPFETN